MTFPFWKKRNGDCEKTPRPSEISINWWRWIGLTVVPVCLLAAWEIAARRLDHPWLLPTVGAVMGRLAHPLADLYGCGSLWTHVSVSLVRVLIGFSAGAVVGILLGVLMGSARPARGLIEPVVELLRPLCPIAWLPFAIAIFGMRALPQLFGVARTGTIFDQVQQGMVFVLFFGAVFPILINTMDGVSGVRHAYVRLARSLGSSRRQLFFHVYLPAALPMILTGVRQGIGTCWMVIIAAEMLPGSDSGIGYALMYAADKCDMDVVVAAMLIIGGAGAILNWGMLRLRRAWAGWHGKEY